ncbi:MAG: BatD family protein [Candidatus Eisenbacteria bacterium]
MTAIERRPSSGRWGRQASNPVPWLAKCVLLAWAAIVSCASLVPAASAAIRAELDRPRIGVGGQAVLSVSLEGLSGRSGRPEIPGVEGLEFHETGRSSNISWVNGHLSTSTVFTYIVVGRREGSYRIGPIHVEDGGTRHESEILTLEVAAGQAGAPGANLPSAGAAPSGSGPAPQGGAEAEGVFARIDVEPREAFVDQQITLRYRLYQREDVQIVDIGEFEAPSAEGFWREGLGPQRDYWVEIDGTRYLVREMAWALFPTRSGELEIGPSRITCHLPERSRRQRGAFSDFFDQGRFGGRPISISTPGRRIRVLPLPAQGRPAEFTGSVGSYEIEARRDGAAAHQGEPVTLQVIVKGTGHIQTIGAPAWPEWEGLRVYDSGEAVTSAPAKDRIAGEKTFTQVLIPSRAGRLSGEPVRFAFFDPDARRYRTVETGHLAIDVLTGGGAGPGGGDTEILPLGEDILYIRTGLADGLAPLAPRGLSGSWVIHLIPLLLLGAAAFARSRRLAIARDPRLARRSRASREALRAVSALGPHSSAREIASGVAHGLEQYLSDWLDLPVRGTRRAELRGALVEASVPEELIEQLLELLDWSEEARFGAGAQQSEALARVDAARGLIARLEGALRNGASMIGARLKTGATLISILAGLCLATAVVAAAAVPQSVADATHQAERAYGEGRYEEALQSYRQVLEAGWVSSGLYYNLGCSAFRSGALGWAVAYFEEARRLAPRDAEIRHNLSRATARMRDRLPQEKGSWVLDALASILDGYAPADIVRAFLVLFWAGAFLLAARWFVTGRTRTAANGGLAGVGILLLLVGLGATLKAYQVRSAPSAVVVAEEVDVRAGPRAEETVQFALHEGTRLQVGRSAGAWREVWLSNEMRGWVPAEAVTELRTPRWIP